MRDAGHGNVFDRGMLAEKAFHLRRVHALAADDHVALAVDEVIEALFVTSSHVAVTVEDERRVREEFARFSFRHLDSAVIEQAQASVPGVTVDSYV
jgi:hypothetical protein